MTISGQTYTRKIDSIVLDALSNIAQSLYKMCSDIRLLQSMHELSEPFGSKQVGSSAMAYKQNPIKCENICSLSRHIISNTMTAKMNVCTQWLERTLDDSANRRMIIPETFIMVDHILNEAIKIIDGLVINGGVIKNHIKDNAPFILMENIIMSATKMGISRQEAHSRIRDLSVIAMQNIMSGGDNNLLELIGDDDLLGDIHIDIDINKMIGMAKEQVDSYLKSIKEDYYE
jgi:adenylosuccinate lyase